MLAKFRGKSKYGYFALSQGGATFEIVEGVKTFESMIFDLTTGNIQEFKAGTWQVNSTEKIQLVDSRTKFIQQLSYPPSLFLLIAILKRYSIPYVDNTSRGGAFWIDGDLDSLKWLIDGLTSIGFSCRFKKQQ